MPDSYSCEQRGDMLLILVVKDAGKHLQNAFTCIACRAGTQMLGWAYACTFTAAAAADAATVLLLLQVPTGSGCQV
jgi:hypothetical protein